MRCARAVPDPDRFADALAFPASLAQALAMTDWQFLSR
jgi:hypothetical protein